MRFDFLSGCVRLWSVPLDSGGRSDLPWAVLSRDEVDRAARIPDERIRRRYVVGRVALRRLLGERLAIAPSELRFDYGAHGKPSLEGAGVSFNLSHSGDLALIAIADHEKVGVDLEQIRPRPRLDLLLRRVLTEEERGLLGRAQPGEDLRWFLRCWTAKEAVAKALGFGLALAPSRINVVPDGDDRAVAEIAPAAGDLLPTGAEALQVLWPPGFEQAIAAVATNCAG